MLKVPAPSPPVPTMSMASSGASTGTILSRRIETAAAISSDGLARDAQAHEERADLAGVASPAMIVVMTARISSPVSVWRRRDLADERPEP